MEEKRHEKLKMWRNTNAKKAENDFLKRQNIITQVL